MSVNSLGEGQSVSMSARGMFQIQAHSLGSSERVLLELRGDATANRADESTLKVIGAGTSSSIVLKPVNEKDFGPGRSAQIIVTRGRPGSDSAQSIEFPRVTLDGRSEVVVGLITSDGDSMTLRAEGLAAEGRLDGPAATVRAAMRSALDDASVRPAEDLGIRVHVDRSASMSAPSVLSRLAPAVDFVVGVASVLAPSPRVTVVVDGETRALDSVTGLEDEVRRLVESGAARIGGGETVRDGFDELTFVISDSVPAAIADAESNAVALDLRGASRIGSATIVPVDDRLVAALDSGRSDSIRDAVEAVVAALRRISGTPDDVGTPGDSAAADAFDGIAPRGDTPRPKFAAPSEAPARPEPAAAPDPFGAAPAFGDVPSFRESPAFGGSAEFDSAPEFGRPDAARRGDREADPGDEGRREAPVWPTSPTDPGRRPGDEIKPPMFGAPADRSDEDDRR